MVATREESSIKNISPPCQGIAMFGTSRRIQRQIKGMQGYGAGQKDKKEYLGELKHYLLSRPLDVFKFLIGCSIFLREIWAVEGLQNETRQKLLR